MNELDLAHLAALSAAVAEGTFDAAARRLNVTPSAVSQRIKALELSVGRVLVQRSKPVVATESGTALLRLARQIDVLRGDVMRELGGGDIVGAEGVPGRAHRPVSVPIAVNADSLATWMLPAVATLSAGFGGDGIAFDFHREDESHTAELLRAGTVMAAVTARAEPVQGCSSDFLGLMRYRPAASPEFARRWFANGGTPGELALAPVVVFDSRDTLQHRYLRLRASEQDGGPSGDSAQVLDPPRHTVPASADFVRAVALGLGWGMVPDLQRPGHDLVEIDPEGRVIDVPLHWQQWQLRTPSLDRVAAAVMAAAALALPQR